MYYRIILLLFLTIVACKKDIPNKDYTIISGQFYNTNDASKTFEITSISGFSKVIKTDTKGIFKDTIHIPTTGMYTLKESKRNKLPLYLTKGSEVAFTGDNTNFMESVVYSNNEAGLNNFFVYKTKKEIDFKAKQKGIYLLDKIEFDKHITLFHDDLVKQLNETSNISAQVKSQELGSIAYNRLNKILFYPMLNKIFSGKEVSKTHIISKAKMDSINLNKGKDFLYSAAYRSIVSFLISQKTQDLKEDKTIRLSSIQHLKSHAQVIKNDTIRNLELYRLVRGNLPYSENKSDLFNTYAELSTNALHIKKVKTLYSELSKLESGKPSPKFTNYEHYDGSRLSLDDLKGRYVYIDIWATWCKPCIAEIPSLKKLEKKYHNKNIVFASISIDNPKNKDKWKDLVKTLGLDGIQLFADSSTQSEFMKSYKVALIPRFILIAPNGNIVKAKAPRPSSEDLITLFDALDI